MELATLFTVLGGPWLDEILIWTVALIAGVIGVVALVNALDMFLDVEAG